MGMTNNDMQAIGHLVGSLASVLVVAAVQWGIPLTPGQQSSILSVIAVLWALFATVYGIRHRIPRGEADYPPSTPATSGTPDHIGARPIRMDGGNRTDDPKGGKTP